ncbi:MAG TPA: 2-hydroxychromene-2-carboxylate isomerase [Sphingomicrobium sp.]|jgi:2-hydroxychromene-2-carboxylate isomerase
MPQPIFYFDFGSPNAFLCHRVIPGIEDRTGVTFHYVPILLGGLFKLTGNQSPITAFAGIPNKLRYQMLETQRFVARHDIADFVFNPHFPVNTLLLMRGAIAASDLGIFRAYVNRVYDDLWTRGLDMGQADIVAASLRAAGLPADEIFTRAQSDRVKQRLLDNTRAAHDAGAFGSPSFVVDDELFFGKDRLRDVEEEIIRRTPRR